MATEPVGTKAEERLRVTLIVVDGPQKGLSYYFVKPVVKVGRRRDMDFILSEPTVSGEHARFLSTPGGVVLEDLGSTNGTQVNGQPATRAILKHNDEIILGNCKLIIAIEEENVPKSAAAAGPKAFLKRVLVVGFPDGPRQHLLEQIEKSRLSRHMLHLDTGEELLIEITRCLSGKSMPDVVIMNLKIPIINGVNTAIALRALENGYQSTQLVPLIFFFNPPPGESFQKVLQFCQPARHIPAGQNLEQFKRQTGLLITEIKAKFPQST